jgi:hypothetical protein
MLAKIRPWSVWAWKLVISVGEEHKKTVTILRETMTCSVRAGPRKDEAQGPWLMGEQFTSADLVIGSNFRWSTMFKLIPERKEFLDYADRRAGGAARGGQGQGVRRGSA